MHKANLYFILVFIIILPSQFLTIPKQVNNTAIKPKPSVRSRTYMSSIFCRGGTYISATVPTCQVYLVAAEHI